MVALHFEAIVIALFSTTHNFLPFGDERQEKVAIHQLIPMYIHP